MGSSRSQRLCLAGIAAKDSGEYHLQLALRNALVLNVLGALNMSNGTKGHIQRRSPSAVAGHAVAKRSAAGKSMLQAFLMLHSVPQLGHWSPGTTTLG